MLLLREPSNKGLGPEHNKQTRQLLNCLFGRVYENARLLGVIFRMAYMPTTFFENRLLLEPLDTYATTEPHCIKLAGMESLLQRQP